MPRELNLMRHAPLIGALVVGLVYMAGQSINARLGEVEIKTAAAAQPRKTAMPSQKTFYPVLIERAKDSGQVEGDEALEGIFSKKVETVAAAADVAVEKPSRSGLFLGVFRHEGRAHNGIFVQGRFFPVGDLIDPLAFVDADGVTVMPRLVKMDASGLTFDLAGVKVLARDEVARAGR